MHVVQIEAPKKLTLGQRPDPTPLEGEVCVRPRAAGVCGTDLHVYMGVLGIFPIIPGHDVAGVIESVGPGVPSSRIGSRVTIDPAACCTRAPIPEEPCPACSRGATHLCSKATYMGMSVDGIMAEYVVVPSLRAVDLPHEIDDMSATVLEPFVVALHLLEQIADRPGPVLLLGGGPIGVAAAMVLGDAGRELLLAEPLKYRRQLSETLGIDSTCSVYAIPAKDYAVIVEASGHPSATDAIVEHARPGSTIVLVGGPTEIPARVTLTRELEIRVAKGGRGLYQEAIQMAVSGKFSPGNLVTHTFPVAHAERAFQDTLSQPEQIFRTVLDMSSW